MNISFKTNKLAKECNDRQKLIRRHGQRRAKLIMLRLTELRAADSLSVLAQLYSGPARCHELHGRQKGMFSVDLDYPYRLLFRPAHNPVPKLKDGGIDWGKVTAIEVLGVEDTHE